MSSTPSAVTPRGKIPPGGFSSIVFDDFADYSSPAAPSPRGKVPPGGVSSIVFDDNIQPVDYLRLSYSLTADKANNPEGFDAAFMKPAVKKNLTMQSSSSIRDLLQDHTPGSPDTPRAKKGRQPPGGNSSLVLF